MLNKDHNKKSGTDWTFERNRSKDKLEGKDLLTRIVSESLQLLRIS